MMVNELHCATFIMWKTQKSMEINLNFSHEERYSIDSYGTLFLTISKGNYQFYSNISEDP